MPPPVLLHRLVYVSAVAPTITDADVRAIVAAAQARNQRLGVTGMLVRSGHHFAQVLEGGDEALQSLLRRIEVDPRHARLRVLARDRLEKRQFGCWSLGLVQRFDLDAEIAELHRTGRLGELDLRSIVGRLTLVETA